jgi:hypothetical protein
VGLRIWNGTNGSWSTPGNWYRNGVPQPGDTVAITAGQVDANGVSTANDIISVDAIRSDIQTGLSIDNTSLGGGSTTNLIGFNNTAHLTLNNAVTDGTLVAGHGPADVTIPSGTDTVNRGTWNISSTSQSSLTTIANGSFLNAGVIESGSNAAYTLSTTQDQTNYGTFKVDSGGTMTLSFGDSTSSTLNILTNAGKLIADGGIMNIDANVQQTVTGTTEITDGGTLTLSDGYSGGTIQIDSGKLAFAPSQFVSGSSAASGMQATIDFTGSDGEIDLGQAVAAAYQPSTNDILVTGSEGSAAPIADIHLVGSYDPSNFAFGSNGEIYYHHS